MYITVIKCRHNGLITIKSEDGNAQKYSGYTIAQALKQYREANGLKYKHLEIISLSC